MATTNNAFVVKNGLTVNGNLIYAISSQVGINNTTPDAALTVTGNANVQGNAVVTKTLTTGNVNVTGYINSSSNVVTVGVYATTVNASANIVTTNVYATTVNASANVNTTTVYANLIGTVTTANVSAIVVNASANVNTTTVYANLIGATVNASSNVTTINVHANAIVLTGQVNVGVISATANGAVVSNSLITVGNTSVNTQIYPASVNTTSVYANTFGLHTGNVTGNVIATVVNATSNINTTTIYANLIGTTVNASSNVTTTTIYVATVNASANVVLGTIGSTSNGTVVTNSSIMVGNNTVNTSIYPSNVTTTGVFSNSVIVTGQVNVGTIGATTTGASISNSSISVGNNATNTSITSTSVTSSNLVSLNLANVNSLNVVTNAFISGNVIISGNLYITGTTITSNATTANGDFAPYVNVFYTIGNTTNYWKNIYASISTAVNAYANAVVVTGQVNVGTISATANGTTVSNSLITVGNTSVNTQIYPASVNTTTVAANTVGLHTGNVIATTVNASSNVTTGNVYVNNTGSLVVGFIGAASNGSLITNNQITVGNTTVFSLVNPASVNTTTVYANLVGTVTTANVSATVVNASANVNTTTVYANLSGGTVAATSNVNTTTLYGNVTGTYANITGQVNTSTFYASLSANVGSNVQLTTTGAAIGNSTLTTAVGATVYSNTGAASIVVANGTSLATNTNIYASGITTTGSINAATVYATISVNSALLTVGTNFIANTTGAYHTNLVNAASHTVGALFTANSTLVNAAAINVVNQVNTATFYAATSANVGTALTINSIALAVTPNANFGSGKLFVDVVNSRVGINTASPSVPFEVAGFGGSTYTAKFTAGGSGGTYVAMMSNASLSVYNNLVQVNDNLLTFSNGAIDTGALVIGGHSTPSFGLRLQNVTKDISFTANSFAFNTGNTNFNSGKLFVDAVNGGATVGIGTTTPFSFAGYGILTLNGSAGSLLSNYVNGTENFRIQTNTYGTDINQLTALPIVFKTTNAERMRIDSVGRVGIGVTPSSFKLEVAATSFQTAIFSSSDTISTDIFIQNQNIADNWVLSRRSGGDAWSYLSGAHNLIWYTNAIERMRIGSTGSVGIGGGSDASINLQIARQPIHSAGYSYVSHSPVSFSSGTTVQGIGHQTYLGVDAGGGLGSVQHFRALQGTFSSTVTNQMGFVAEATLTGATYNYGFYASDTGGAAATTGKTMFGFISTVTAASGGGGAYNFYASGSAPSYFGGNVGISTTATSSAKLTVATSDTTLAALFSGASKGLRIVPQPTGMLLEGVDNTGLASYQPLTITASVIGFTYNNTTKMTVDASGLTMSSNIAVGTSQIYVGTSTANAIINSTAIVIANSTASVTITANSNAQGKRTVQSGGSPTGGTIGDIYYIY